MKRFALLGFAALAACSQPDVEGWREERGMDGVDYVGRIPDEGDLIVNGWRNDGGFYVSDELHAVSAFSNAERMAISADAFRHREDDGAPAWTIADFWSHPADRESAGFNLNCGIGADETSWSQSPADRYVALVEWRNVALDQNVYHDGVVAAVRVNMETGDIEPVPAADVYCYQELL